MIEREVNVDRATVRGFGEEWTAFDQQTLSPEEHRVLAEAYFSVFPFADLPPDAEGFDMGCGSGRWAAWVLPRVGRLHCIDPSAAALAVARRRLGDNARVEFHHRSADEIDLPPNSQDFGYCLGVLHHIPDPARALRQCVSRLKAGAPFLLYIYYRLENRPAWYRGLWRVTDVARRAISRLPFPGRRALSGLIAAAVYWPLARGARLAERLGANVRDFPLSSYRDASFYTMRTDALDRFGTRLEHRFSRGDIEAMMRGAGLTDIRFRENEPYWVACGRRAHDEAAEAIPVIAAAAVSPRTLAEPAAPLAVAFVIKSLSQAGGGAERVLADVAGELARRGHAVTVISYDSPSASDFYAFDPAVRRLRLGIGNAGALSGPWATLARMRALRRIVKAERFDVVAAFMHSSFVPVAFALARSGVPVVASEHIVHSHYHDKPLHRALLRATARHVAAFTAISADMRDGFPPVIRDKMAVIANPVAAAPSMPLASAARGPRILSVGRLVEQKDHRTLIAAFARVAQDFPDWTLRIIGEGPLRPVLKAQIAELGLDDRVELPGATDAIDAEYAAAQLVAMPSSYESFGLVTAEALARGLPVIGFADCPGTNELVVDGENGLLVEGPDRVAAFARALTQLMGGPAERARLGANGPARLAPFALNAVASDWERLLAAVASPTRRPMPGSGARPPNIVHVVPSLTKGGGERVAVDLANHAVASGDTVTIVASAPADPALLPAPLDPRIALKFVQRGNSRWGRYLALPGWVSRNAAWLGEQDVIHCHLSFGAATGSLIQAMRRLTRARRPAVIETYHAVGIPIPRFNRWLNARLIGRRDAVSLMAEDSYWRRFAARRPRLNMRVIPNGVNFGASLRADSAAARRYREQSGVPGETDAVVGSVGRLAPERRPDLYIPVFARIAAALGADVHFLLAGAGPELPRIQSLRQAHGLQAQLHLPGLAPDPRLPMAMMDLYVTINVGPITGIAALEAAAAGIPVVAIQLLADYTGGASDWIWSSTDLAAVADEALRLLRDPAARQTLARRQRAHVRQKHSVEVMARSYRALYDEVLAEEN